MYSSSKETWLVQNRSLVALLLQKPQSSQPLTFFNTFQYALLSGLAVLKMMVQAQLQWQRCIISRFLLDGLNLLKLFLVRIHPGSRFSIVNPREWGLPHHFGKCLCFTISPNPQRENIPEQNNSSYESYVPVWWKETETRTPQNSDTNAHTWPFLCTPILC